MLFLDDVGRFLGFDIGSCGLELKEIAGHGKLQFATIAFMVRVVIDYELALERDAAYLGKVGFDVSLVELSSLVL